jgi:hypothetical protein
MMRLGGENQADHDRYCKQGRNKRHQARRLNGF